VSPSWRDRLLIGLAPDRVAALHLRRGLRPALAADMVRDCAVAGAAQPWAGALEALESLLAELPVAGEARVVLSNHFVRYGKVPWTEGVFAAADRKAMAAGCFRAVYGEMADGWQVAVEPPRFGCDGLAAAADRALVDALRACLAGRRLKLTVLRPHLTAAFDRCRPRLESGDGGFVLVEPGCVTALFCRQGIWAEVANRRYGRQTEGEAARIVRQCADADQVQGGEGPLALLSPGSAPAMDSVGGRSLRRLEGVGGPWPEDPWRSLAWSAA